MRSDLDFEHRETFEMLSRIFKQNFIEYYRLSLDRFLTEIPKEIYGTRDIFKPDILFMTVWVFVKEFNIIFKYFSTGALFQDRTFKKNKKFQELMGTVMKYHKD